MNSTTKNHYKEIFDQLNEYIKDGYVIVDCFDCEIVLTEEDGYRFKDLTAENYFVTVGNYNDELLLQALCSLENDPLKVDKAGHYSFKALLSFSEAQIEGYGEITVPAYHFIEHIEFKYQCSHEEMFEMMTNNGDDGGYLNF